MSRIRCMRSSGRIKSLRNRGHAHYMYSDAIEWDPNYRNAPQKQQYKRLTPFELARVMHNVR